MLAQLPLFTDPPPVEPAVEQAPPKTAPAVNGRAPRLTLDRRADGWAIAGLDVELGPYATRAEADDDRRGLQRFYRDELVSAEPADRSPPVQHLGGGR